jgi:hypothetical protein
MALAQNAFGGYLIQSQRGGELGMFSEPIDRLKVVLTQTQQSNVTRKFLCRTHRIATQRCNGLGICRQVGAFIQCYANEAKPRVRGPTGFRFGDDEPSQSGTP